MKATTGVPHSNTAITYFYRKKVLAYVPQQYVGGIAYAQTQSHIGT